MMTFEYNDASTLSEEEQHQRFKRKRFLRQEVETAYDAQDSRIRAGNRLFANFQTRIGALSEDPDKAGVDVLRTLKLRYDRITEGLAVTDFSRRKKFSYDGIITERGELELVGDWISLMERERRMFRNVRYGVEQFDIWEQFLKGVGGCGPAMAGICIAYYDMHKAPYPSSLISFTGLDVAEDGRGRSRRKEHLVEQTYTDSNGEEQTKMGLSHNPYVKTKIRGVLAECMMRASGDYKDIYDDYRHRIDNMAAHDDKTKSHRHNMALRYMVKQFLKHLYNAWRPLEGLPVAPTYAEAKLGHTPHGESK